MNCKYCQSPRTMKYGFKGGNQYYKCNDCMRKFAGTEGLPGMRHSANIIGAAIELFYNGLSSGEISRLLIKGRGIKVDPATVWRWVMKYSKKTGGILNSIKVRTSKQWVVNETVIKMSGEKVWFWDVIESDNGFLLATHLSLTGNKRSAVAVLSEASSRTMDMPVQIVSSGVTAYPDAVEMVFGAYSAHTIAKDLAAQASLNIIDEFQEAQKTRIGIMRGLKTLESAKIISEGFIIHYNFLRPGLMLKGKTPAVAAGLNMPFRTWAGLVDYPWKGD